MDQIAQAIGDFGFPIIAALGMGYFIYFIWKWVTEEIDPVLGEANVTLIALIDRVRMLDNDLIRLNQKLNVILTLRDQQSDYEERIKHLQKIIEDHDINIDEHEKVYSLDDLKKIYKEQKTISND
jgi:SpoVK/Ycf46/Vps4 family AAA+-type ATPase